MGMASESPRRLLFLCTGNYFRSRFAEQLFNRLAPRQGLNWSAFSRALAPDSPTRNPGPMSIFTIEALRLRGVEPCVTRGPLDVTEADFQSAQLIVAAKEAEHRPLARARFPAWEERIEYWHCHDLDCAEACDALNAVEAQVLKLVERLRGAGART
jgi:protein-tyrosine phosphatase